MAYQMNFLPNNPCYESNSTKPLRAQLLKWVGNKQKFASEIISFFPERYGKYIEPFLGSGGVLGSLAPVQAIGSDIFHPLIEIFQTLKSEPETLKRWYSERYELISIFGKQKAYEKIKASYNTRANGPDLLFLSRSCYGGVVRFRKADGYMSTPVGIHDPISPNSFSARVDTWHERVQGTDFINCDFSHAISMAEPDDLIYCDPPYSDSQGILYGAQEFELNTLINLIADCKNRGVYVALSIDGIKKSGNHNVQLAIPDGLFEREIYINVGRSMLRRFQREGETLEDELVSDRLLLTY